MSGFNMPPGVSVNDIPGNEPPRRRTPALRRLWNRITGNWWTVRRCYFPYPPGYATYNEGTRTVLDTGLTREEAQELCDQLNA